MLQQTYQFFNDKHQEPIRQIAFYLYVLGGIGCALFAILAYIDQNWLIVATSSSVLIVVIFSLLRFESNDTGALFGKVSICGLTALIIGTTFNFGINDTGIQAVYPILLMIGVSYYSRPKRLLTVGIACMVWVIILNILEQRGFYVTRSEPFTLLSKTIFIIFMIFFTTMMLMVTLHTIMTANSNLNIAKEEAIAAKIVAESANQAKTNFLANMSHELRTPLNAIIGYSEMIEEINEGETAEDAGKIQQSASNLLAMINTILEISKIESGNLKLEIQPVDISKLVPELKTITGPDIASRQNKIRFNINTTGQMVMADRQKLQHILINLISNANKFSNSETISIDIKQQDQSIICDVSDNGVGIPQEDLERIFMPFEQVYNELNREFEGTGLGLAICRQYARSMGGDISVQSKLKVGSTFRLTLPAAG